MTRTFFRINAPQVVYQVIEGEAIIIDLETGAYFSLVGTGAAAWERLAQIASLDDIVQTLMAQYAGNRAEIQRDAEQFLYELEREALITPSAEPPPTRLPAAVSALDAATRLPFHPPALAKYTDMQDLLLLDPIHGVDEQGWPVAKT